MLIIIALRNFLLSVVKDHAGCGQYRGSYRTAGGTEVVSIITKHSAEHLALIQGKDVYAVIKVSNVIAITD